MTWVSRFRAGDTDGDDLAAQRHRLATVPIDERLRETIAWSAVLLADEVRRSGVARLAAAPDPIGLGRRRP